MESVAWYWDDTDMEEVVRMAQMFAQPLNGRLQQGFNAMNHNLVSLWLILHTYGSRKQILQEVSQCERVALRGDGAKKLLNKRSLTHRLIYSEGNIAEATLFSGVLHKFTIHGPELVKFIIL